MESLRENICCIHIHLFYYIIKHFYSKRVLILFHAMCTNFPKFSEYVAIANFFLIVTLAITTMTVSSVHRIFYILVHIPWPHSAEVVLSLHVSLSVGANISEGRVKAGWNKWREISGGCYNTRKFPQTLFKICKTVIRPVLYGAEHRQYEEQHILGKLEI